MSSNNALYGLRSNGLNHGEVYTSPEVICFILDAVGYTPLSDLSKKYILEPSFGNGDFLIEIQHRIVESSKKHGFDPVETFQKCVFACEIDTHKFAACIERLQVSMPQLTPANFKNEDFLHTDWNNEFDIIVGNPPYVRYENIPIEARNTYKAIFKTFYYRCDLYVLFYEHSLKFLKSGGKHGFICSNRWLKNEYGKKLRSLIGQSYNLEKIVDIEKLDAFQESVLAYPLISIISNSPNKQIVEIATVDKLSELNSKIQYKHRICTDDDLRSLFTIDNYAELPTIEEQGFSIGIGVATGADKIFINRDLIKNVESDLIIPIICSKDLSKNRFQYNGLYLFNPYDRFGNLVNLDSYPRAKAYLEQYKTILQNRYIAKKNRPWYSLIDKVKPELLHKSKILIPDISANTHVFVDKGNFYPAHNIYYIISDSQDKEQLYILAAFLMSDFVRNQLIGYSNKMNGGLPRWQSHVLRKLRIPRINEINTHYRKILITAYEHFNITEINRIVNHIWELTSNRAITPKTGGTQLSVFNKLSVS